MSTCRRCGDPVERRGKFGPAPLYCSQRCRRAYQDERRLRERHASGCLDCGAPTEHGHRLCPDCRRDRRRHAQRLALGLTVERHVQRRLLNASDPTLSL